VEFGLLGPLLVRSGDAPVQVSAGKHRVLLAALLLQANQVVAAGDLASAIWQDSPPETVRATLQNYVMRLRRALGPAGYERILSRPAGYLIEIHPGELDVAQFAELQGSGLAAARADAWEDAAERLTSALQLWRGQPLADVPSALLEAEVARLAEMRLVALETRIDAHLHLGRHQEVTAELAALATAEPLRERVHELLMVALYRSGRQAAALAAYQNARRHLVDELGIDPGPGLRELNQRILQADPALLDRPPREDANLVARPPGQHSTDQGLRGQALLGDGARQGGGMPQDRGPHPSMLPAGVPGFTGRDAELRALSAMLLAAAPGPVLITAVGGTAGVGKTSLAVHWAREHASDFPGGQLYVNLRGFGPADPLSPSEALRIFLDALAVPVTGAPATLDGFQALYRGRLVGTKTLIVLDNARDPDQIRPLLPGSKGCLVIVTSRNELTGLIAAEGAQAITLDVLTTAEARQLLIRRLGPERVAAEPDAAAELISLCARLPLALAIAAARATTRPGFPLSALAAELRTARSRLDALDTGEDTTDVRAVFSWSYCQLSPAAARMFRMLGLHPGPDISVPAAASLAGVTPAEVQRLLRELTRDRLLTEHSPGRHGFHDLLRAYAAEQATTTDHQQTRHAATGRMLDHYLHTAHTAALLMQPHRDPPALDPVRPGVTPERLTDHQQALAWFEAEHHVLLAVVSLTAETGFNVHAWQLPWALASFLDWQGHWHEWAAVGRAALAAAIRLGDKAAQAMARRGTAAACFRIGDHGEAHIHLTECLSLYRQLGDRGGEARIHHDLSGGLLSRGRHADAIGHAEQALALFRAIADRAGEAHALNNIGWCHAHLGNPLQARTLCQQALSLYRELGNRYCEAHSWDSLGYAELQLGRLAVAADCYQQALALFREVGDRFAEAENLTRLGDAHQAAGDEREARDAWRQALAVLDDLHHPDAKRVRAKLAPPTAAASDSARTSSPRPCRNTPSRRKPTPAPTPAAPEPNAASPPPKSPPPTPSAATGAA
jgi:DNA-binding SARP family transcriptional activator